MCFVHACVFAAYKDMRRDCAFACSQVSQLVHAYFKLQPCVTCFDLGAGMGVSVYKSIPSG